MTTNFPGALDTLTNPTANIALGIPVAPHSDQHANANDAIEALEVAVGITNSQDATSLQYRTTSAAAAAAAAQSTANTANATANAAMPNTTTAAGTLIYGATAKTTPVDADILALADSAASNALKKLSWANIKSVLQTAFEAVFAKAAGLAGGQTLNGGTAASETLTLASTSHGTKGKVLLGASSGYDEVNVRLGIGTQSPSAKVHVIGTTEQSRLGYDLSNYYATTVSSAGVVTHEATGIQHIVKGGTGMATLGANMIANGTYTSDISGWLDSGSSWSWSSGAALHTAGAASTLSQAFSTTAGSTYYVGFTLTRSAGSVSITIGGDTLINQGGDSAFVTAQAYARGLVSSGNSSAGIVITPTSDFAGTIDNVRCFAVTIGSVTPSFGIQEGTGVTTTEFRASPASSANTQIGANGMRSVVGATNTAVYGADCGRSIISGTNNLFAAPNAGYSAINPIETTLLGAAAGYGLINPYLVTAVGRNAARYLANGSTAATIAATSVYLGANTKLSADNVTNENVFGYNATGIGSNSTCIGSSAVTKCQIYGDIILDKTVTAAGTTGAQTINKTLGSVNFAAGAASLVVTNNRVTTSSFIFPTVATNDATMKRVIAVAASGSFTLYPDATPTAETRVNFAVFN